MSTSLRIYPIVLQAGSQALSPYPPLLRARSASLGDQLERGSHFTNARARASRNVMNESAKRRSGRDAERAVALIVLVRGAFEVGRSVALMRCGR